MANNYDKFYLKPTHLNIKFKIEDKILNVFHASSNGSSLIP